MSKQIRLFIADDHGILIDGLIRMFEAEADIDFIGRASNTEQLLEKLRALAENGQSPDIVLLDIRLNPHNPKDKSGLDAITDIKKINPRIKVLIMTGFNARSYFSDAIQKMADGYLSKDNEQRVFIDAVRRIHRGEKVFIADLDQEDTFPENDASNYIGLLTEREREIICHLTEGLTSTEIGKKLYIAPVTVDKHRQNILLKLNLHNVAQLAAFAVRHRLCE
jgi:DNA-binding NarL/FixJ family response regulator